MIDREEDVTQTMYKNTRTNNKIIDLPDSSDGAANTVAAVLSPFTSKVNRICDAVLNVLQSRTSTNLQNIITANVCKSPPALDDGLLVVAKLMMENEKLAEKAVEHICFLADVNKLYDNALGLYKLDLALLVAQQSQKDPREYLPFMQNLQQMSELRRRFSIDDYLGRHGKALTHLHQLDVFEELETYTQKHILYKEALTIYRYQPEGLNAIMKLYAAYLESQSNFREAGIAYEYLHLYSAATECYRAASLWREALFCASQQNPPLQDAAMQDLARALADSLYESKDYFNAAAIHLDYRKDLDTAVSLYCKGYHFATAMQLAGMHGRPDILSSIVDVGLTDALATSTELLADCKAQLAAQVPRIRELRIKAQTDPLGFYEGQTNEDVPDDISVAASSRVSTNRSLYTRYTGKQSVGTLGSSASRYSSKNRKREERKRARGKKGSVYEEEYLVNSVRRLIERIESVREDIGKLVMGLLRRGMRERALAVETQLGEVLQACRSCVEEVFGGAGQEAQKTEEDTAEERYQPIGAQAVIIEALEAAGKRTEAPPIGAFEKLSLLGA